MAICPNCHTMDKGFFAPKCHACNTPVGFFEQILMSFLYNATIVIGFLFLVWLIFC